MTPPLEGCLHRRRIRPHLTQISPLLKARTRFPIYPDGTSLSETVLDHRGAPGGAHQSNFVLPNPQVSTPGGKSRPMLFVRYVHSTLHKLCSTLSYTWTPRENKRPTRSIRALLQVGNIVCIVCASKSMMSVQKKRSRVH